MRKKERKSITADYMLDRGAALKEAVCRGHWTRGEYDEIIQTHESRIHKPLRRRHHPGPPKDPAVPRDKLLRCLDGLSIKTQRPGHGV